MSASSSILTGPLLGGFALLLHILFVPLFAVSIKDEIEISCANTHTYTHTHAHRHHSAHCLLCLLTKQRHAVPRHMKESKPLVLLLLYLLLILSLHFLTLCPRLHLLLFLLRCCKCDGRQCDPCFVFVLYFVLLCFLLHHKITNFSPFSILHFSTHLKPPYKEFSHVQHLLLHSSISPFQVFIFL